MEVGACVLDQARALPRSIQVPRLSGCSPFGSGVFRSSREVAKILCCTADREIKKGSNTGTSNHILSYLYGILYNRLIQISRK